jgi:hypothetical protein
MSFNPQHRQRISTFFLKEILEVLERWHSWLIKLLVSLCIASLQYQL